jgi:hypothetical protein
LSLNWLQFRWHFSMSRLPCKLMYWFDIKENSFLNTFNYRFIIHILRHWFSWKTRKVWKIKLVLIFLADWSELVECNATINIRPYVFHSHHSVRVRTAFLSYQFASYVKAALLFSHNLWSLQLALSTQQCQSRVCLALSVVEHCTTATINYISTWS